MLRQCGERRTRLNLPDRVAVARVIHPPADFAFQAGGVADPRVVAAVAAFEAGFSFIVTSLPFKPLDNVFEALQ